MNITKMGFFEIINPISSPDEGQNTLHQLFETSNVMETRFIVTSKRVNR